MIPIEQAVEEYNALRVKGNDHGIIGAYVALCERHGRENLPPQMDLMAARAVSFSWYDEHTRETREETS